MGLSEVEIVMPLIVCKEIKQVRTGFIVQLRYPFGDQPAGYGEVICKTFDEVVAVLKQAVIPEERT